MVDYHDLGVGFHATAAIHAAAANVHVAASACLHAAAAAANADACLVSTVPDIRNEQFPLHSIWWAHARAATAARATAARATAARATAIVRIYVINCMSSYILQAVVGITPKLSRNLS